MPRDRAANCIFCEDIRQEAGNKLSFMGVFSGDLISGAPPPTFIQKLCIITWLLSDVDDIPPVSTIRVTIPPNGDELMRFADIAPPPMLNPEGAIRVNLMGILQKMPVLLTHEGFIEVFIDTERETIRAGRIRIRFQSPDVSAVAATSPTA